jgi:Cft2 family RNA processing exonuclease
MELTFLGGADEVGASSTLVRIGGKLLLVDAGIRISPRTSRGIANDQLPDLRPISEAGGPDYILVTHAHTDHTGALALVVEQYPHVPVLATRPTIALTRILQADAQRIMTGKLEADGELPIFDEVASQRLMDAFQPVEYRHPLRLGDGLQVTYHPSGHIAGAASLILESAEGTLVLSGDVSLADQRAVVRADLPRLKADALVLESTYGGKLHANRLAEERRIVETLARIVERGGRALIPAFALGRAQEILQILLAYGDRLDVPIYADGMVRAVCRAYGTFADLLPEATVRAAGDAHLFFRERIKPVESAAQREQLIGSAEPAVVVASSGMLTGGASALYARRWAGDPLNAILLTGYQDEEAPGRFLQRIMRERQAGQETTVKIDGQPVTVRCDVDTYSLSAHADESELVSLAEALNPDDIMLVHGDPGARHSVATGLRQRGRRVLTPQIGQTVRLAYAPRPWALGQVRSGGETRPLDAAALWEALKAQAGSFFSAGELARMWWGDDARRAEVGPALAGSVWFSADWRQRDTFQVLTPAQAARRQRQRAIMRAWPDLVGRLAVLRDVNDRVRAGVVVAAGEEGFEAQVYGAKGRHYPADALVWPLGRWAREPGDKSTLAQIGALLREAKALQDALLPYERRLALVSAGQPVDPASLLPAALPDGITPELARLALVLALAHDGAALALDEAGSPLGLLPQRALQGEPLEQNAAREAALAAFPPAARLRKVGLEVHRRRLTLSFDFPARAADVYAEAVEQVMDQTGWDVHINPAINQQALGAALDELLDGGRVVKGPSFYLDQGEVHAEIADVDDLPALERRYLDLTGFRLRTTARGAGQPAAISPAEPAPGSAQMEINAAYAVIKAALEPYGLYRAGLKQGDIVLTFISPQVGARCTDVIAALARETGYALSVHPYPNQQEILQVAARIARECGWTVRKGPGIHVARAEVALKVAQLPPDDVLAEAVARFAEQTGYTLAVSAG